MGASSTPTAGLEGSSIGSLAAHIGMSKSGLHAHFGSNTTFVLHDDPASLHRAGAAVGDRLSRAL